MYMYIARTSRLYCVSADEGYNKKGQFGMGHPEDMKSKSQGNLLREDDERMRWQQRGISPPNDSRYANSPFNSL